MPSSASSQAPERVLVEPQHQDWRGMEAHVVMVCRDRTRGEAARDEIKSQSKNESVDLMLADLSLLASVRSLAAEFGAKYSKLDVLINNVAVVLSSRTATPEGFEQMFATNYLGPFLLTRLLIPYLEAAKPSRIINVTAPSTTRPNLDDLQGERKYSSLEPSELRRPPTSSSHMCLREDSEDEGLRRTLTIPESGKPTSTARPPYRIGKSP